MKIFPVSCKFLSRSVILSLVMIASVAQAQTGDIFCPVLHKKGLAQYGAHYFGGLVFLICCPGCDKDFSEHPFQFLEEGEALGQPVAESLFDPIDGKRVVAGSKDNMEYRGIRYVFNSSEHHTEFKSNPELYVNLPKSEVRWDLKSGKEIAYPDAIRYLDYAGIRVYFSDPAALESFQADPAKAYVQLKTHLKNLEPKENAAPKRDRVLAPTCAGCAGEAKLLGPDGQLAKWTINMRYVAINSPVSARYRFSIDHAVLPNLTLGLERAGGDISSSVGNKQGLFNYLRRSDGNAPVMPRFSWFITPETKTTPSLVIGSVADRLSTPKGQAFFLTASKMITGAHLTPFVSVKTNSYEGKTVYPFGVNWAARNDLTLQAVNDGDYSHFLLTQVNGQTAYSLLLARGKYLGFSVSFGF